jgi:hypothetical protein
MTLLPARPWWLAILICACPARAWALFGVGDIVFDPASVAQTINVLRQAEQQYDRLGSLLGVSTRQFDQLVQLSAAVGDSSEAAGFGPVLSGPELQALVQATPGLEHADLAALLDPNGQLDAFLGVSLPAWIQAVENPMTFYRNQLIAPALSRLGSSAGWNAPTTAYAQWFAAQSAEDQANLGSRATSDFAELMNQDWLQAAQLRRLNLQALAAGGRAAEVQASRAATLADQQHAQAQMSARTNQILLEAAAQNGEAQEAALRTTGAQNRYLEAQADARRDAAQMALDVAR